MVSKEAIVLGALFTLIALCVGSAWRIPSGRMVAVPVALAEVTLAALFLADGIPYPLARRLTALCCVATCLYLSWLAARGNAQLQAADQRRRATLDRAYEHLKELQAAYLAAHKAGHRQVPAETEALRPRAVHELAECDASSEALGRLLWSNLALYVACFTSVVAFWSLFWAR